jgi:tRNA dimethylallyltransferase
MGPTAAGKTDLAIEIAKKYPVEIISVDSALVYRHMDIGTAKPDKATLKKYPHYLVDIIEPTESYSAGDFCNDTIKLMAEITLRGNIPLLVGGTMLYFKSLQYGMAKLPPANEEVRNKLDADAELYGLHSLHQRLVKIDPISAQRIHENDPQRLQRALEVYELTGKSLTELTNKESEHIFPYNVTKIILAPFDRKVLHDRIALRYKSMMENNFLDEVYRLFVRGDCHEKLPSIRAVGYRQAWSYLSKEYDKNTFIDKAIIATRQMAKRQLTWLRAQNDGVWFDSGPDLPVGVVLDYIEGNIAELNIKPLV